MFESFQQYTPTYFRKTERNIIEQRLKSNDESFLKGIELIPDITRINR